MKKMYCVEHSVRDFENEYFDNKADAIKKAEYLKDMIANGEISEEEIFVTEIEVE